MNTQEKIDLLTGIAVEQYNRKQKILQLKEALMLEELRFNSRKSDIEVLCKAVGNKFPVTFEVKGKKYTIDNDFSVDME